MIELRSQEDEDSHSKRTQGGRTFQEEGAAYASIVQWDLASQRS